MRIGGTGEGAGKEEEKVDGNKQKYRETAKKDIEKEEEDRGDLFKKMQ